MKTPEMIEDELSQVQTDCELLAFEYLVTPCNQVHCSEDYSDEEWASLCEMDVARFMKHSKIGRMRAFMRINAGLSPL